MKQNNKFIKKIQDFLNEGLRVNPTILNRKTYNKEYNINQIISDLANLQNLLDVYIEDLSDFDELKEEIGDVVLELRDWEKDGYKKVKFYGNEWIPIY